MEPRRQGLEGFRVIGISARTTNAAEMTDKGKIGPAWRQFMSQNLMSQIPDKLGSEIIAVYFGYESDAAGPYTYLLGAKVHGGAKVPEGMIAIDIPKQDYAIFTSAKGEIPGIVVSTWKEVWSATEGKKLKRSFAYDFELYDARAADPTNAQIDVYISTK